MHVVRTLLQRVRVQTLAAAVEAQMSEAPDEIKDGLAVAVGVLGAAHHPGGDPDHAVAQATSAILAWEAWKAAQPR